jgi:hypothetical protein
MVIFHSFVSLPEDKSPGSFSEEKYLKILPIDMGACGFGVSSTTCKPAGGHGHLVDSSPL